MTAIVKRIDQKVDVTESDIATAVRQDSRLCAVATAIARTIPDATHIVVDVQTIRYTRTTTDERYTVAPPPSIGAYVRAFDEGRAIKPFSFTLREAVIKPINHTPGRGGRPKGSPTTGRTTPLIGGSRRRTYGERSIAAAVDAVSTPAVSEWVVWAA